MRAGSAVAAALILFALASIAQLLWVATWKPAPNQINAAWATPPQPPRQHPLLVWVVFDELSYDQVFEHRARDLACPTSTLSAPRAPYSPTPSRPDTTR